MRDRLYMERTAPVQADNARALYYSNGRMERERGA
jgi:hypothetical protein